MSTLEKAISNLWQKNRGRTTWDLPKDYFSWGQDIRFKMDDASNALQVSSLFGLYHLAGISLITSRVREGACGGNGADGYYCTGGASG